MSFQILLNGDCLNALRSMSENSVHAVVCDPPYELGFMGKAWDGTGIAFDPATWREVFRVLSPGGYLLAFGGTRTYHRIGVAIEDAGFEIRDSLIWQYGSGFPKSLDVSKAIDKAVGAEREVVGVRQLTGYGKANAANGQQARNTTEFIQTSDVPASDAAKAWKGWGSALKPAFEPVVVARKPLAKGLTVAGNVLRHGTGALNIDGCRVAASPADFAKLAAGVEAIRARGGVMENSWKNSSDLSGANPANPLGRWPANVILTHAPGCGDACAPGCPVAALDAQSGILPVSRGGGNGYACSIFGTDTQKTRAKGVVGFGDTGGASRFFTVTEYGEDDLPGAEPGAPPFFYASKASRSEREAGCGDLPARSGAEAVEREQDSAGTQSPRAGAGRTANTVHNHHPTVKPVAVMRWLVKLVTPPGGVVLDPFMGSGTTGVASVKEGFSFIGVEREPEYITIAEARIRHHGGTPEIA